MPSRAFDIWFVVIVSIVTLFSCVVTESAEPDMLPGTELLVGSDDLSSRMVAGIDSYLTKATDAAPQKRSQLWNRNLSSPAEYVESIAPNRRRFETIIGKVDDRLKPVKFEYISGPDSPALLLETANYSVYSVRWEVFDGVHGEGLLLEPKQLPLAQIVALPDADQTPEMLTGLQPGIEPSSQFARRFAEAGCRVVVPVLIDRRCDSSGKPDIVLTNQTHREWIYRQAFEVGRHIIGYEVQKVLSAVDWLESRATAEPRAPIGVAGYGEGGLIALASAAVDSRISATLVSGYFGSRQQVWSEPLYRNVFGLLHEFGDAEIASLVTPRALIVEFSRGPEIDGPPALPTGRRASAAPGRLSTPPFESVRDEVERARQLSTGPQGELGTLRLITGPEGEPVGLGSDAAVLDFLKHLDINDPRFSKEEAASQKIDHLAMHGRQDRQVRELEDHAQQLLRRAERTRRDFWQKLQVSNSPDVRDAAARSLQKYLWEEVYGRLPDPTLPMNPRSRKLEENSQWTMYEIVLDVWPDIFAWGYLLVPKGISAGEKRPVVVCQHGLEGLPRSVIEADPKQRDFQAYRAYAVRLAERGFVVYAPHNPYRGQTAFRQLQRKANPLKLTLFSFILGQHQRTLEWLGGLPFVDADHIAFYGLSYGGTSAMRIPSLLDGYCLSICSACFNDWTRKIMSLDFPASYMFTSEYEQFTFNLGSTFNHAEMAALIAPRPFMVERGHRDGVAPDEWVAYEYAKVRRHYADLGISDRTEIEFFDGGHEIHGRGTFDFLHKHLNFRSRHAPP